MKCNEYTAWMRSVAKVRGEDECQTRHLVIRQVIGGVVILHSDDNRTLTLVGCSLVCHRKRLDRAAMQPTAGLVFILLR